MRALVVPVRDEWYALELPVVREIVGDVAVTPLPGAPASVLGVFNLRGDILPLLDTAALLGLAPLGSAPFVAVVDGAAGPAGLAVTGAPETVDLGEAATEARLPGAVSRHQLDGRIATLIDPHALTAPVPAGR